MDKLATVTDYLTEELLNTAPPDDKIQLCGQAALAMLYSRPVEAYQLAHLKIYTWQYDNVPEQWRRLYEEACLHLAAEELQKLIIPNGTDCNGIVGYNDQICESCFCRAIMHLDKAIFVAGAPGRRILIMAMFDKLEAFLDVYGEHIGPIVLNSRKSEALTTDHPIQRELQPLSLFEFQQHLDNYGGPMVIHDSFGEWPATRRWQNATYLLERTLGGRRTVPVEIGASYTSKGWTQEVMTVHKFMERFIFPENPAQIGYLAQHDLLSQVPALRSDILTPDYCFSAPPAPKGAAALTVGLDSNAELGEPLVHAWLGPKGTKTPLHTDAYHNILCQVVGHKYVRLYAPEEKVELYPMDVDERGVKMANTSSVCVEFVSSKGKAAEMDAEKACELEEKFPRFKEAKYVEAILGPGEALYVPLGWWHYVESLTNSFSVSFWFN
ncbi:hypothetical protein M409DRAFT_68367 [Zasmidium cellare ATCC 36951]|uniref:JmjC domain-containing protein n=1 Tax=Zasmidium cellare ATCC 36951 TaxID=1080233 RepID=A0A6A6CAG5_ZASCE|nr:uncharacterized protein M409DRAFT_68367 [Zasmidium cellare ATCC 36951]KAF2163823.1 hypothetical protein M409DRAFT_68367 [Zasmidium cellare ATCC 36951]